MANRTPTTEHFTGAMANAATGVTIVTTNGTAGRFGVTVSSVSSVSADPPLILACVNRKSPAMDAITENGSFAVNILADHQADVAANFAGRTIDGVAYNFDLHNWNTGIHGIPVLNDCTSSFQCLLHAHHDAGTHRIFIGDVMVIDTTAEKPLIYSARKFHKIQPF